MPRAGRCLYFLKIVKDSGSRVGRRVNFLNCDKRIVVCHCFSKRQGERHIIFRFNKEIIGAGLCVWTGNWAWTFAIFFFCSRFIEFLHLIFKLLYIWYKNNNTNNKLFDIFYPSIYFIGLLRYLVHIEQFPYNLVLNII
jgi:hypothetical protein